MSALQACQLRVNGKKLIGSAYKNNCWVVSQDKALNPYSSYLVLSLDVKSNPAALVRFIDGMLKNLGLHFAKKESDSPFVAGINQQGNLSICRGAFGLGLQVGMLQDDRCLMGYAGKSQSLKQFEALLSQKIMRCNGILAPHI